MRDIDHSFDWKGFRFFLALFAVLIVLGAGVQTGISYASSLVSNLHHSDKAILAQATIPLPSPELIISTTTPQSVISKLTIADVVPQRGKFIAADLVNMELYLYKDGTTTAEYPILTKGRPGTPYETPSGAYAIESMETNHVNYGEGVTMPYSMQFYGNYFIHGWPTYLSGAPVASDYSGGCIRLSTADAAKVYAFADVGTKVFVYDAPATTTPAELELANIPVPKITASAYLVADVDTGDVYAEEGGDTERPIASITKLMTALVANETIMFNQNVTIPRGELFDLDIATGSATSTASNTASSTASAAFKVASSTPRDIIPETFTVGDLLYPMLMESNNHVADRLASYYGTGAFVSWMNQETRALDMASTTFVDASGVSRNNVSTPEDLYRLAVYLADKKSFVWDITRTPTKTITAKNGSKYSFISFNEFSGLSSFVGGKIGETAAAGETMVSIFTVPVNGEVRRVAIIILDSDNDKSDTQKLDDWFNQSAVSVNLACVSCAVRSSFPKISL